MTNLPMTNENFYRLAWQARLELIERWCREDGANAWRVLKRLELHEMRYELGLHGTVDRQTGEKSYLGEYQWKLRPVDRQAALPTGVPAFATVAMRDKDITVPFYADLVGIPGRWLAQHLQEHRYDAIVELGCGTGRNIFSIYYHGGPASPYFAGEFTESGRQIVTRLAAIEPVMNITVVPFDHTAPDFSFLAGCKTVLLFSVHSIEQVTTLPADYFDRLARAADKVTGIHFEPFGFQLGRTDPVAVRQRNLFVNRGWNQDLLERLRDADKRGAIRMTFLSDNMFSNTQDNPTSVAIWESAGGGASE